MITPLFIVDLKKNLCRLPGREEGVCEWVCGGAPALHNLSLVAQLGPSTLALLLLAQMVCKIVQISFSKILKVLREYSKSSKSMKQVLPEDVAKCLI